MNTLFHTQLEAHVRDRQEMLHQVANRYRLYQQIRPQQRRFLLLRQGTSAFGKLLMRFGAQLHQWAALEASCAEHHPTVGRLSQAGSR
ncbi:MAG: hypothetical protein KF832_04960 [Caldilineaceae bacterium]|nr:hypothetical protein [Caldilineaceae bacterium]